LGQENSAIEGTGIGLMVTKNLVELMKGRIGFESIENVGSTFWVELALSEQVNTEKVLLTTNQKISGDIDKIESEPSVKKRVLYVEDNSVNQKLMSFFFEAFEPLELSIADSAEKGWEMLSKQMYDIILMDIHLPKMNGIEFTHHLKSLSAFEHIPIIAVTAAAMKQEIDETNDIFDYYLTKPINISELTTALKNYQ